MPPRIALGIATRRGFAGLVVALWGAALAFGLALAPRLPAVAVTDPARFFPDDAPSREAAGALARLFPGTQAASQVVVVLEATDAGAAALAHADRIAALAEGLRRELGGDPDVSAVLAPTDDPVLGERLVSADGRAALVVLRLVPGFASEEASAVADGVERIVAAALAAAPGLRASFTGDATLGRDYLRAIEEGAQRSALATVALVALALLAVYRAPLAAAVPVATLAIALGVASGATVLAAEAGLPVAYQSRGFLVALVWGVGTDYCLLLFGRVREEAGRTGAGGAVPAALRRIAPVLVTSALAVVLACALMGFARFGLFADSGPALALGVAVTLAAVLTLAPALMTLAGPGLFWPAPERGDRSTGATRAAQRLSARRAPGRVWPAIARLVLARPVLVLATALVGVAPLVWLGLRVSPSFELELDVPVASESEAGFAALVRHFDPAQVSPLVVAVELPEEARTFRGADALDGLYQITEMLAAQPGVSKVWSATRPTGAPGLLARATLRSQLAELGRGLGRATAGAGRLAGGLDEALRELARRRADVESKKAALVAEEQGSLLGAFAPQRFADARRDLDALAADLARLEAGLAEAARGAHALEDGVARGRDRLADLDRAPGSARLLDRLALTPEDVASSAELRRALDHYLSADGRAARFEIALGTPPNAPASVESAGRVGDALAAWLPAQGLPGARVHVAGPTAITRDLAAITRADMERLDLWIVAGVFVLLVLLLRGLAAPAAITGFILVSYFAALGALELLVRAGVWPGVDWKAPFFLFVLLVAIGADYGVFLLGRAREEAAGRTFEGVRARAGPTRAPTPRVEFEGALARALEATGPVVTSCGLVLAGTFATLLFSRIAFLEQVGVGITVGVLIDTGVVRPFLLPATALLLARGAAGAGARREP